MKSKYCERLTQGLAISGSALALSACDAPQPEIKPDPSIVEATATSRLPVPRQGQPARLSLPFPKESRNSEDIGKPYGLRERITACLKRAYPQIEPNYDLIEMWGSTVSYRPFRNEGDITRDGLGSLSINLDTCSIEMYTSMTPGPVTAATCFDKDTDGKWESVRNLNEEIILSSSEKQTNSDKWHSYQDMCRRSLFACLSWKK